MEKFFFTFIAIVVVSAAGLYTLAGLGWDEGRTNLMLATYAISLIIAYIIARWALKQGWTSLQKQGVEGEKK